MKWLSKRQYVYRIRNCITHQQYVGSTDVSPFGRWADLFSALRNNRGNLRFQAAWDAHPSLIFWEFAILAEITPKVSANQLRQHEAKFICKVTDAFRLNIPHRTTITREKHARVLAMLADGRRYVDIRDEVGISIGMISRIKQRTQP